MASNLRAEDAADERGCQFRLPRAAIISKCRLDHAARPTIRLHERQTLIYASPSILDDRLDPAGPTKTWHMEEVLKRRQSSNIVGRRIALEQCKQETLACSASAPERDLLVPGQCEPH